MRALIRPTLFMIARLGLFLSVVAWIAGQWWLVSGMVRNSIGSCEFLGGSKGLVLEIAGRNVGDEPYFTVDRNFPKDPWLVPRILQVIRRTGSSKWVNLPGFTAISNSTSCIFVRHWFIVTIFALFNGVLMLLYRKRPEVVPCEV